MLVASATARSGLGRSCILALGERWARRVGGVMGTRFFFFLLLLRFLLELGERRAGERLL